MDEKRERASSIPDATGNRAKSESWIAVMALCLWLALEIGRPPSPLRLPLLCSVILGGSWLLSTSKRWDPILICMIGFLATGWIGVPLARNQYSAFWACYSLTITILCICLAAATALKTLRQIHVFVWVFLASTAYLGLFAITHAGLGPAGSSGGQDENYVAAAMSAALPFAYFGLSAARRLLVRAVLMGVTVVCLLATVIGFSRGGFLGISAAGLFCFWYSPRKLVAIGAAIVGVGAVAAVAPSSYWNEVSSIGDTSEATADLRLDLWAIATRLFLHNPILGVAPGNFIWNIEEYQTQEVTDKIGRKLAGSVLVHSTYFEVLSELGGLGSSFFLAMLYFSFRELRRVSAMCHKALKRPRGRQRRGADPELEWARAYALSFQGGLIGYLVCSAFLSTTYYSTIWLMCSLTVALRYAVVDILRARPRNAAMASWAENTPAEPRPSSSRISPPTTPQRA